VEAIRRQLAAYYGRDVAGRCTWEEMRREALALGGAVSWKVAGHMRKRHFRGVELAPARGFLRATIALAGRLEAEGLPAELPQLRRDPLDLDPDQVAQPGGMYCGGDGVRRQVPDPEALQIQTGRRGQSRRFHGYLAELRLYLEKARMPAEDRAILEAVLEGKSHKAIAAELGETYWRVRATIYRWQGEAGIRGPGRGR
jgi:hypothetical protein